MAATLGSRVRELRVARGMSQTALAGDLVSPSYVSLIEGGKRMPEPPILQRLAQRLGTTVEFLERGAEAESAREDRLWLRYAELALANGQVAEALSRFEQLAAASAHVRHEAEWGRAQALDAQGDHLGAIAAIDWLLAEYRAGRTQTPGLLPLLTKRCWLYQQAGDLHYSIALGEEALEEVRRLGLRGTEEEIRLAATLVAGYWERGDWVRAHRLATEVVERADRHGSPRSRGSAYWNASLAASAVGGLTLAVELAERAIASYSETVDERGIARLRYALAWLLLQRRPPDLPRIHELLVTAHATLEELRLEVDLGSCETELARYHLLAGDPAEALRFADQAIARLTGRRVMETVRVSLMRGYCLAALGDRAAGLDACREAVATLRRQDRSRQHLATWRDAAALLAWFGEEREALDAYRGLADCAGVPEPSWLEAVPTPTRPVEPERAWSGVQV